MWRGKWRLYVEKSSGIGKEVAVISKTSLVFEVLTPLAFRRRFAPQRHAQSKGLQLGSSVEGSQTPPARQRVCGSARNVEVSQLTESCHSTKSTPVTISVTGCLVSGRGVWPQGTTHSTCNRVFLGLDPLECRPNHLHLHEEVLVRLGIHDKLDGSRPDTSVSNESGHTPKIALVDCLRSCHGLFCKVPLQLRAQARCRRFFDDFCGVSLTGVYGTETYSGVSAGQSNPAPTAPRTRPVNLQTPAPRHA